MDLLPKVMMDMIVKDSEVDIVKKAIIENAAKAIPVTARSLCMTFWRRYVSERVRREKLLSKYRRGRDNLY